MEQYLIDYVAQALTFQKKLFYLLQSKPFKNDENAFYLILKALLDNTCIEIVCFPGCDIINYEVNLIFLRKSFF